MKYSFSVSFSNLISFIVTCVIDIFINLFKNKSGKERWTGNGQKITIFFSNNTKIIVFGGVNTLDFFFDLVHQFFYCVRADLFCHRI